MLEEEYQLALQHCPNLLRLLVTKIQVHTEVLDFAKRVVDDLEQELSNTNEQAGPEVIYPTLDPNDELYDLGMVKNITLTPIAKKTKKASTSTDAKSPDSKRDYLEQMERERQGMKLMWDDRSKNDSLAGTTMFAFVFNNEKVKFHIVTNVMNPEARLVSWSQNVGQDNRNVLELSNLVHEMDWETWLSLGGHKKVQGTTCIASKSTIKNIINYIMDV